jgi:hypothetical protein
LYRNGTDRKVHSPCLLTFHAMQPNQQSYRLGHPLLASPQQQMQPQMAPMVNPYDNAAASHHRNSYYNPSTPPSLHNTQFASPSQQLQRVATSPHSNPTSHNRKCTTIACLPLHINYNESQHFHTQIHHQSERRRACFDTLHLNNHPPHRTMPCHTYHVVDLLVLNLAIHWLDLRYRLIPILRLPCRPTTHW